MQFKGDACVGVNLNHSAGFLFASAFLLYKIKKVYIFCLKMFDTKSRFDRMRTSQRGAVSSVGRAMPLQGMGHKFESCTAHHILRSHEQGH
jgi:hypothetical protein